MPAIKTRESYKIVVEPMSSVYVHECPPESPEGKIGSSWLTEGKRVICISLLDVEIEKVRFFTPISTQLGV